MKSLLKLVQILLILIWSSLSFYSKHFKKCVLPLSNNTLKFDLGSAKIQRVPEYGVDFEFSEQAKTSLQLQYTPVDFIYDQYIDAGGSGEVYRIQDLQTGQPRVLKRFFKQKKIQFQQQNYIMKKMGYEVNWHKQDNNFQKSTMASFPSKQSIVLRDLQIDSSNQFAVTFYKICRQLAKAHKKSIIHNDMKMGNILISSVGQGLRTIQVQLIDWNLATFYSKGYQSTQKKGTVCYYSPEGTLRTNFITPATDIWSLAIVYFTFITDHKPFTVNCKQSNFQAILTYAGGKKLLEVYEKYNKINSIQVRLIEQIKKNNSLYEGLSLRDRIPAAFQKFFDNQLIDLFQKMLQVDPEYRLTITQVINHPYFDRIKRLPKMYEQKNRKKNKSNDQAIKKSQQRQVPANNLVQPPIPSQLISQQH